MVNLKNLKDPIIAYKTYLDALCSYTASIEQPEKPNKSKVGILIFESFLKLHIIFQHTFKRNINKKYIFVNARYDDIILSLDRKDVVILGGVSDLFFCLRNRIKFIWIGYLTRGFDIYFYHDRCKSYIDVLTILSNLVKKNICCESIFLWEDNIKVGLVFSYLFKESKDINIVSIQHGLFVPNEKIKYPGSNSNYNFVIKNSQKKLIGCNDENSCVIGLTYDINHKVDLFFKNVYLVGVGRIGRNDTNYLHSIYLYSKIMDIFEGSEYKVFYRPHHTEDINFCRSMFHNIDTTPKKDLLSGGRYIYIGFESTLLYEAKFFNNLTVGIDPNERAFIRDFELDIVINEKDIGLIFDRIKGYIDDSENKESVHQPDIRTRFIKCMERLEYYSQNKNKG